MLLLSCRLSDTILSFALHYDLYISISAIKSSASGGDLTEVRFPSRDRDEVELKEQADNGELIPRSALAMVTEILFQL